MTNDLRDQWTQDQCLTAWNDLKKILNSLKAEEMELRKYIVKRAFPAATEGTNTQELGNGYSLKAGVKFTYKLDNDNSKVETAYKYIRAIGNEGPYIAARLITFSPEFHLKEYRAIQQQAKDGSEQAKQILKIINEVLTVDDAAPTLTIVEPKKEKK